MLRNNFSFIAALIIIGIISSCSTYHNTGIGEVSAVKEEGAYRTEGGGVDSTVLWAGTAEIAKSFHNAHAYSISYTPRVKKLDGQKVLMQKMKNLEMSFNIYLQYMINPENAWRLFAKFRNYDQEITRILRESTLRIMAKLDMGVNPENMNSLTSKKNQKPSEFESREAIANKIFEDVKKNFQEKYPDYKEDVIFLGAALGNADFPRKVLSSFEKAVAKQYETEVLLIQKNIDNLKGKIKVKKSEADLDAFSIEAGATTPEVLRYLSFDIMEMAMKDENTEVLIVMPVDKNGNVRWFVPDKEKKEKVNMK